MKQAIYDSEKKKVGEIELADEVFAEPVNMNVLYEAVKAQNASSRQGDAFCKSRKLVSGSTKKIYRQKGTGRARHSDRRANIFVGGGKSFGPRPRDYSYSLPKQERRLALRTALAAKNKEGSILILKDFTADKVKTSPMVKKLNAIGVKNGLVVVDKQEENLKRSIGNIAGIKLVRWDSLNVVDILKHQHVVFTVDALNKLQETIKP
jgi:large subunit ribosomal protein L4